MVENIEDKLRIGLYVIWDDDGYEARGKVIKAFHRHPNGVGKLMYEAAFYDEEIGRYTRNFDNQCLEEDLRIDKDQRTSIEGLE